MEMGFYWQPATPARQLPNHVRGIAERFRHNRAGRRGEDSRSDSFDGLITRDGGGDGDGKENVVKVS